MNTNDPFRDDAGTALHRVNQEQSRKIDQLTAALKHDRTKAVHAAGEWLLSILLACGVAFLIGFWWSQTTWGAQARRLAEDQARVFFQRNSPNTNHDTPPYCQDNVQGHCQVGELLCTTMNTDSTKTLRACCDDDTLRFNDGCYWSRTGGE